MYDDSAPHVHEWEFRTSVFWAASKEEDKPKTMSAVIERLRGDSADSDGRWLCGTVSGT